MHGQSLSTAAIGLGPFRETAFAQWTPQHFRRGACCIDWLNFLAVVIQPESSIHVDKVVARWESTGCGMWQAKSVCAARLGSTDAKMLQRRPYVALV